MQITARLQLVSVRRHHQANLIFLTLLHKSPLYINFPKTFYKLRYKFFLYHMYRQCVSMYVSTHFLFPTADLTEDVHRLYKNDA